MPLLDDVTTPGKEPYIIALTLAPVNFSVQVVANGGTMHLFNVWVQ